MQKLARHSEYTNYFVGVSGFGDANDGEFYVKSSSTSAILVVNPYAVAETKSSSLTVGTAVYHGTVTGGGSNPTHLWISSLALNFSARPYPYKIRDKWEQSSIPWWAEDWNIGTAQTTVGALNPGSTTPFEVTIPNVKQTSDSIQIAVSFSGERYQYVGR